MLTRHKFPLMNVFRIISSSIIFFFIFGCAKVDKRFYCSKESNSLRKIVHIPIIEDNMTLDESAALSDSRWQTSIKYPTDTIPLHAWKTIVAGKSILTTETDAFRKRINDTLFYQLNIDSKIHKDSSVTVTGLVFYTMQNESKSISLEFDNQYKKLDSREVDSVKKEWNLGF